MSERKRIFLCLAHMSESGMEQKYVKEAFDTNWVVPLGPNVNGFEQDLESYIYSNQEQKHTIAEGKKVCALSSGTAAVHLGLIDIGVRAGDEVICQSLTFCASVNPVIYLGAKPIFIDSELDSYNMDPDLVEYAIKDRIAKTGRPPKAIVLVHLYGMPAKIDRIIDIANHYDIPVMEDAAEAMGSLYNGQLCGTFGKYGVWSFNGNKIITTSGGGALICPNEESKRNAIFYATQAKEPLPYYQHEVIGFNYRLSNICAGIGRGQMHVLSDHIAHHQHLHDMYVNAFKDNPNISVQSAYCPNVKSNYWLSTILLNPESRVVIDGKVSDVKSVNSAGGQPNDNVEQLRVYLDKCGIETRPLWKPMHCMPVYGCYQSPLSKSRQVSVVESKNCCSYVNGNSEILFHQGLCLPSGPCVTDEDTHYIADCINNVIQ